MTCEKCGTTLSSKNVKCDCERKKKKVDPDELFQKDKRFNVGKKASFADAMPDMGAEAEVITKEEKENAENESKVFDAKSAKRSDGEGESITETDELSD